MLPKEEFKHIRERFYRCPYCTKVNEKISILFHPDKVNTMICWNCSTKGNISDHAIEIIGYGRQVVEYNCKSCAGQQLPIII